MANQYINKVIVAGVTRIDLTGDTVDASHLLSGKTAHDRTGAPITGECTYDADTTDATAEAADILAGKTAYCSGIKLEGTMKYLGGIEQKISSRDNIVVIGEGYHDGSGNVTIAQTEKDKLVSENIKSGITILGVTGNYEGSGGSGSIPSPIVAGDTPVWCDMTTHIVNGKSGTYYSFTPKKEGTYKLTAILQTMGTQGLTGYIRKNGTNIATASFTTLHSASSYAILQTSQSLTTSDTITVYISSGRTTSYIAAHGLIASIDWDNGF